MKLVTQASETGPEPRSLADAAAFSRRMGELVEGLSTLLTRVLVTGDEEAVHDLRVVTRRLQEALAVLRPESTSKKAIRLRKDLRRARRALGAWRNYDVTAHAVATRRRATRSPGRRMAWNLVGERLERRRVEEMVRAREILLRKDVRDVAGRLAGVATDLIATPPSNDLRAAVLDRTRAGWAAWQVAFAKAEETPSVEAVHALRIATKRLRYRAELARELGENGAEPALAWAREIQTALGDWHDRRVLEQLTAEALARPEVLLEQPLAVKTALDEIERERRRGPQPDAILALVSREAGGMLMERWLGMVR